MDIFSNLRVEERTGVGAGAPAERGSKRGCRDVLGEIAEQVELRLMSGGIAESEL